MLRPVWPSLFFWQHLGVVFLFLLLLSFWSISIIQLIRNHDDFVNIRPIILFLCFLSNWVLGRIFEWLLKNPDKDRLFPGYERFGKIIGAILIFSGNILVHYAEKSVGNMLIFLFLACNCLCTLFYLQPYTDFGVLGFLLSGCVNQALNLFGLRSINTWLVIFACFVIVALWYGLEPIEPPGAGDGEASN